MGLRICFPMLCILVLLFWNVLECTSMQYKLSSQLSPSIRKSVLRPVLVSSFTTFKDKMATYLGISETLLESKPVLDWYNREIVASGKYSDLGDSSQSKSVGTILLSMLCASCYQQGNCECLLTLGCSAQCK